MSQQIPDPAIRYIRFDFSLGLKVKGGLCDAIGYYPSIEEARKKPADVDTIEIYDSWTGEVMQFNSYS